MTRTAAEVDPRLIAFVLPSLPESVRTARFHVRAALGHHGLGDYAEDAELVTSELFFPGFGSVSPKFAPTSRTKRRRRDGSQVAKPMLGLIVAHPYWRAAEADLRASAPLLRPPR